METLIADLTSDEDEQHAASKDPAQPPVCDPHYFENKIGKITAETY